VTLNRVLQLLVWSGFGFGATWAWQVRDAPLGTVVAIGAMVMVYAMGNET
jgi:hypothetical protein